MIKYRTIIKAEILQRTSLSIGGSESDSTDAQTFRNGGDVLTIPASGITGAFVETIMRLFPDCGNNEKWKMITGKRRDGSNWDQESGLFKSIFKFYNCHPTQKVTTEWRQGVGINSHTGTAAKGALFEFETVPSGTNWHFLMEIDTHRAQCFQMNGLNAEEIATLVLGEWEEGYAWMGRNSARGCGWFSLGNCRILQLPLEENTVESWPDSGYDPFTTFESVYKKFSNFHKDFCKELKAVREKSALNPDWSYIKATLSFSIKEPSEGDYGCENIQANGHSWLSNYYQKGGAFTKFVAPRTFINANIEKDYQSELDPDKFFPVTSNNQESFEPYLPGSSIRGSLRSLSAKLARMKKTNDGAKNSWGIIDPTDSHLIRTRIETLKKAGQSLKIEDVKEAFSIDGFFEELFGISEISGKILISDARVINNSEVRFLQQEQHAEDEFCCGVYGTSKFNSTLVIKGEFEFDLIIEGSTKKELKKCFRLIQPSLEMAKHGWMPIGGGKNKGSGFVSIIVSRLQLKKPGQNCQDTKMEEFLNDN